MCETLPAGLAKGSRHRTLFESLRKIGLGVAVALFAVSASADPTVHSEAAVKAALIFNFAKFVEWPAAAFADTRSAMLFCIYRETNTDLRQALGGLQGRVIQGREIQVRAGVGQRELGGCHVLYVPDTQTRWLPEILRSAQAQHALTVSDMEDFIEAGGIIELVAIDNQQRFEINLDSAQKAQLKISAQLLKLAKSVRGSGGRN